MKDIFTSFDDEEEKKRKRSTRISFENDSYKKNDVFTHNFEDINTGRDDFFVDDHVFDRKPVRHEYNYSETGRNASINDLTILPEPDEFIIPHESTDDEFGRNRKFVERKTPSKKKKRKAPKIIVATLLLIIIALVGAASAYAYNMCGKVNSQPDTHEENKYISESALYSDKNVYNLLIIGTDKRANQANYRSDTMILVSLDKRTKKIKLTSFLRDSYVYIPAKDYWTKLNASCAYGGPQMVIDTIEYNFKVHIDNYVMIDFDIFKSIINDLGGVTLTITKEEADCITRESGKKCKAGTHTYNGRMALWYARIRHLDSDFKRTERQRKVIQAVIDKVKQSDMKKVINMLNNALPLIQTDMTSDELFKLGLNAIPFLKSDVEEMQIPAKGTWENRTINGQAVLKLDVEKNTELLKEFLY